METTIFEGGILIDGTGKAPIQDCLVVVEGTKIKSVSKKGEMDIPRGERVKFALASS